MPAGGLWPCRRRSAAAVELVGAEADTVPLAGWLVGAVKRYLPDIRAVPARGETHGHLHEEGVTQLHSSILNHPVGANYS